MEKNMGIADRIIRIIIAVTIGVLYLSGVLTGALGVTLLVFAGIFLFTASIGICPLYMPFGIRTCHLKKTS